MCRMVLYKGPPLLLADLITNPEHSIIHQSYDSRERREKTFLPGRLNADGFGIGWYSGDDPRPCLFTSVLPAWNNRNLHQIANKIESSCFFGHIRAASMGSIVSETNCHPFSCGRYMFMHNGALGPFKELKRTIINGLTDAAFDAIEGSSDSEYMFGVFLSHLSNFHDPQDPFHLLQILKKTLVYAHELCTTAGYKGHSHLNFAITDGSTVLVARILDNHSDDDTLQAASMYYSCGTRFKSSNAGSNVYFMAQRDRIDNVVIVASERITHVQEDWVEMPSDRIMLITPSNTALSFPFRLRDHCSCCRTQHEIVSE